jgi:voltage-gated potassium channel Kch
MTTDPLSEDAGTEGPEASPAGVPVRERYGLVLLLILGSYLLTAFDESALLQIISVIIWVVLLLVALWSPGIPHKLRRIVALVTVLMFISAVALVLAESIETTGVMFLLLSAAQILAVLIILWRILQHDHVTIQTVMGGVAAYAMIGFTMAAVYRGFDLLSESPFLHGATTSGDYVYFSFVTLTTVGFGDITAATDLAKRLVVVEAFVGQVFLITLVARLVSLWGQPMARRQR